MSGLAKALLNIDALYMIRRNYDKSFVGFHILFLPKKVNCWSTFFDKYFLSIHCSINWYHKALLSLITNTAEVFLAVWRPSVEALDRSDSLKIILMEASTCGASREASIPCEKRKKIKKLIVGDNPHAIGEKRKIHSQRRLRLSH